MKFAVTLTCIFLSISTLVSAARVTSRSSCQNSQVTGNSTIEHEGSQIGVVTGTCSPPSGKRSTLAERQSYSLCTEGICSVTCSSTSYYTIYTSDCQYVLNYLSYYSSYTVLIPAFSYQEWYYGTCAIWFWNFDLYDYEVCIAEIAYDASLAESECEFISNGATCSGSQLPGDAYEISIQSP